LIECYGEMFALNYKTESVGSCGLQIHIYCIEIIVAFCLYVLELRPEMFGPCYFGVFKILEKDNYRCYVGQFRVDLSEWWFRHIGDHIWFLGVILRTKPHISLCMIVLYSINEWICVCWSNYPIQSSSASTNNKTWKAWSSFK